MAFEMDDAAMEAYLEGKEPDMETLKNIEHIKDYGDSGIFPVFGGKF